MGIFSWLKNLLTYDPSVYKPPVETSGDSGSGMNEGDFRSGPQGYSPNTAYPEAFYNSGESKDEGQDEGDLTR
ncbi:unannotated protein [freshwater metagenome]|jgi:hypothetical protein|uniref:Unannotated protein n=1 Tax=freshwater metagenome TaxID=449393 RepID=A0A6J6CXJ5_9ZZZZ|nr:hypothetical protein [Actinomycetota bacterium]